MTLYADRSISLMRPDQRTEALYLDRSDLAVDASSPFFFKSGRRPQGALAVRLTAILTTQQA